MSERLCSVGLDVGTTTTQLIVSELTVENRASPFAVPEIAITDRKIRYRSPIHFTPLLDDAHVDAAQIRALVEADYEDAGLERSQVDTGAVIITGETARKENASAVLSQLSEFAGEFVVATAGPDLESSLAARGAEADLWSAQTGKSVLHFDIGGGTSNLALFQDGVQLATGCLNVGGRLLKFDPHGTVTYVSPVLDGIWDLPVGSRATEAQVDELTQVLAQVLEMAAGLRPKTPLLDKLITNHTVSLPKESPVISFSGGVADCIETDHPWLSFGDMGPSLGRAIRRSRLCQGVYRLGKETIRATVIGAGCHSAQLSGSTIYHRGLALPLKNLPVAALSAQQQEQSPEELGRTVAQLITNAQDEAPEAPVVLAMPGFSAPSYSRVAGLAQGIAMGFRQTFVPPIIALEQDMAKALGQAVALLLPDRPCLCIDRVRLAAGSYLDIGAQVGPALSVVVKTLILSHGGVES